MSHPLPRFMPPVEPPARREKIETFEPDSEEEYTRLKADAERAKEIHWLLLRLESLLRNMSDDHREEVEARTGFILSDIKETALPGIVIARRNLEAGARAWETRPADTIMEDV